MDAIADAHAAVNARPRQTVQAQTDVVRSNAIPQGTIEGVVVGASNGEAVAGASVFIGDEVRVQTDSLGRFRIQGPAAVATLTVLAIDYDDFQMQFDLRAEEGLAAVIALAPFKMHLCPVYMARPRTVIVEVRDARSGQAPSVPVTLELIDGAYREYHTEEARYNRLVLQSNEWRAGHYTVRVTASGYSDWEAAGVVPIWDLQCGRWPWQQSVWLLPRGQNLVGAKDGG